MKPNAPFLISVSIIFLLNACVGRDPKLIDVCNHSGKVRDLSNLDGCKWAIELEDGSRLIPVAADQTRYQWKSDVSIMFGYEEQNEFNTCMAGKTIHLTCLTPVEEIECKDAIRVMPEDSFQRAPAYNIIEYSVSKGKLKIKIGFSGCDPDRDFILWVSETQSKSLPPQRTATIHFSEQACLAYFEKELCFNTSFLTEKTVLNFKSGNQNTSITVEP